MSFFSQRSMIEKIADAAINFAHGAAKEFGIEVALEAYVDATKKFVTKIEQEDVGNAFLRRFRGRFMRVLKITVQALDEIDAQIHGHNPGRWHRIEQMMQEDRPKLLKSKKQKDEDDE